MTKKLEQLARELYPDELIATYIPYDDDFSAARLKERHAFIAGYQARDAEVADLKAEIQAYHKMVNHE